MKFSISYAFLIGALIASSFICGGVMNTTDLYANPKSLDASQRIVTVGVTVLGYLGGSLASLLFAVHTIVAIAKVPRSANSAFLRFTSVLSSLLALLMLSMVVAATIIFATDSVVILSCRHRPIPPGLDPGPGSDYFDPGRNPHEFFPVPYDVKGYIVSEDSRFPPSFACYKNHEIYFSSYAYFQYGVDRPALVTALAFGLLSGFLWVCNAIVGYVYMKRLPGSVMSTTGAVETGTGQVDSTYVKPFKSDQY